MSDSLSHDHIDEAVVQETEEIVPSGSKDYKCPYCPKQFLNGASLKDHIGLSHCAQPVSSGGRKQGSGRLVCPVGCEPPLSNYESLLRHCSAEHGFQAESINMQFENFEEFKVWMDEISALSGLFVRKRGERKAADGTIMGDFHCSFDGKKRETPSVRAPDKTPYNRRAVSKKMGFACPAYIRYIVESDQTVTCRAQVQHFGHPVKPVEQTTQRRKNEKHQGVRMSGRGRRNREYAFDAMGYDEITSRHLVNQIMDDEMVIDEHGMVPLYSISHLERARFLAQSSCTSMDISFAEVQTIPPENVQHVALLIEKFNEITSAATQIETILKAMSTLPEQEEDEVHDANPDDESTKVRVHSIRKRPIKEERTENGKQRRIELSDANEDESFEQQSDGGDDHFEVDRVAGEVEVHDEEREEELDVKPQP